MKNNKSRRFISYTLAVFMILSILPSYIINAIGIVPFAVDRTPPVIHDIQVDKQEVEAPGVVTVTFTATDDLSGIGSSIYAVFINETTGRTYSTHGINSFRNSATNQIEYYPDNIYKGEIAVGTYDAPGNFVLDLMLVTDNAGNSQYYTANPDEWQLENGHLPLPNETSFTVVNDKPADLATNTANPKLVQDIEAQDDDAVIIINYDTGSNISDDVFDAIKDTNKTIILQGNGIEWVFNGSDIASSKNIDTNVLINPIDQFFGSNASNIAEIVQDVPTIVLSFAENGILPGKAIIRVKADYTFRSYIGVENIYVYYFDRDKNELVSIASNLTISERDGYLEFEIYHNSDFIITRLAIDTDLPEVCEDCKKDPCECDEEPINNQFALTVNTGVGGRIIGVESGNFVSGTIINIIAVPNDNYTFIGWSTSNGGTFGNVNSATTTFTMPDNATAITANFAYIGGTGNVYFPLYPPSIGSVSSGNSSNVTSDDNPLTTTNSGITGASTIMMSTLESAYAKGFISITAAADGTVSIPVSLLNSVQTVTKDETEVFTFNIETNAGIYMLPANITAIIPNFSSYKGVSDIKITITNTGETVTGALSDILDFKLELIDSKGRVITEISEFSGVIKRVLTLSTLTKEPEYWGGYTRKDGKSAWEFVPAKWNSNGVIISSNKNSEYVAVSYTPKFTDVSISEWYYNNITLAASKRLVKGINEEETLYNPEAQVTRAEFITMIVRALRLPETKADIADYTDINSSNWFYSDVMKANSIGLLTLLGTSELKPNQAITREEMAYILSKAAEHCKVTPKNEVDLSVRFEDSSEINENYAKYVENAVALGLMQGMSANTFEAKGTATRAQAATVLINMCKLFDWID